jgi:spore coat protein CotH
VTLTRVGVRNKGQTSFQPVSGKPGFSVKLNEFVPGQKLDGLKKLLLNNTVQDPTWCNETLTYETYRRAGIPAPRVAFAVVTLNGVPKGIYSIGEAVNAQFLARHYGDGMDQGNLYEGPWDFSQPVENADLKDEVEENRSRDDLRALTALVLSPPDQGFAARVAAKLDLDQFIRGYAVDAVTVAWDGYAYDAWNYYLYDHPGSGRFVFLPAGANWPYFRDAADAAPTVDPRVLRSLWGMGKDPASFLAGARIQPIPSLDARFDAAVRDVARGAFDVPALHADFDRIRAALHSVPPANDATRRDLETFDDHVHLAYEFVEARKKYLLGIFP